MGSDALQKTLPRSAGIPEDKLPIVEVDEEQYIAATYNDPELTQRLVQVFERTLGPENVVEVDPVMGGEDFGQYTLPDREIPIFLFWLGTVSR